MSRIDPQDGHDTLGPRRRVLVNAGTLVVALVLGNAVAVAAAPPELVRDINPSGSSEPEELTRIGSTLYFTADDGISGEELWKSDGTAGGTVLVKDIHPGASPSWPSYLTNVAGTLYFGGRNPAGGFGL